MRKLIVLYILIIIFLTSCANQRNINQFYNKYQGTENTTSFKAPMFLSSLVFGNSEEYELFRKKIKSVRVLTMRELSEQRNQMVQSDIKQALIKDGFENWFNINQDGRVINVSAQNRGNSLKNLVVSMQGADNLIFINAKTNLTEAELTRFITKVMKETDDKK
ncbi:DUF4252 domain-containing protein [Flavobacteriaceae bacterium Ap0902]|nr:DUF4252 domain-containing protein [Flavobacteriaceae bacterium Ap0902]